MNSRFNFPDTVPLVQWEDGSIRVQGTRLLLAMILTSFQQGNTPDEINDSFPSASVTQIQAVIGWYLDNKSEGDTYLEEYHAEGERLRVQIESRPEYKAFRKELERRREEYLKRQREQLIKT
ncbi:MAG TPA: DUF433 domain-containing protein [Pyrinomonadaceae bacterium]|nr:DUF433 domain-containing protein [Pyrinomonadaceae bacterium]